VGQKGYQVLFYDNFGKYQPIYNNSFAGESRNEQQMKTVHISLRFNGHFPGEPGLAGVY